MPTHLATAAADTNAVDTNATRKRGIARVYDELHGSNAALFTAANAIAAGMNANTIDGDGAAQLLLCIYERQERILSTLDSLMGERVRGV